MKIQTKILLSVLPAVAAAMALAVFLAWRVANDSVVEQAQESSLQVGEFIAEGVNRELLAAQNVVVSISYGVTWTSNVQYLLAREHDLFPEYSHLVYIDRDGSVIPSRGRLVDDPLPLGVEALRAAAQPEGALVVVERPQGPALLITSPTHLDEGRHEQASPRDGIVVALLPLETLIRAAQRMQMPQDWEILLLDAELRPLLPSDTGLFESLALARVDETHPLHEAAQQLQTSARGSRTFLLDNQLHYISFVPIESMPWVIVTTGRLSALQTDQAHLALLLLGVLGVSLALAAVWSYAGVRTIVHPVRDLIGHFQRFEEGDFHARAQPTSHDEIGQMARAFNNMTGHIQSLFDRLQYRMGFEELLIRLSASYLHSKDRAAMDEWLHAVLLECAEYGGFDFATMGHLNGPMAERTFHWLREPSDIPAPTPGAQSVEQFKWLWRELGRGNIVNFRTIEELPEAAQAEREAVKSLGYEAGIIIGMRYAGRLQGYMAFLARNPANAVRGEDIPLMRLLEELVNGILDRRIIDQELRQHREHLEEIVEERTQKLRLINLQVRQEIEERKRAEHERGMTEERYRVLVEQSVEAIVLYNPSSGAVLDVNPAFCRLLGYAREDAIAMSVQAFAPGGIFPEGTTASEQSLGTLPLREDQWQSRSGQFVDVEVTGTWMARDGEQLIFAVARDVSAQKWLQARLQMTDRLASVGTLAAGVAHEINNPLAFVIANLDYLREELQTLRRERSQRTTASDATLEPALGEWLDVIERTERGAERVRRIVQDLHAFARSSDEELGPVNVHDVLDSAITLAASDLRQRTELVQDYGAIPPARANVTRLGQVFLNLIVNAMQALPDDRPADQNFIRIRTASIRPGEILVEICDNGRGIPPELIKRIFDPFFTTKSVGVGAGLGLFICHNIVHNMGGSIEVDSAPGNGACFRVTIPAMEPLELPELSAS